jgi:putative ABC transport system permease protein
MMRQSALLLLRLATRSLQRGRGASIVAVLTLAIGLSAAVVILGVVDSALRPLPVPGGRDIVEFELRTAQARRAETPVPLEEWATGPGVMAAGALRQTQATLAAPNVPAWRGYGAAMHPSVLQLLRVQPLLGRLPAAEADDEFAIVLGHDAWQQLGGDPALVGRTIDVDGAAHTVIGIMPANFGFPERHSYWTVLPLDEGGEVVARLEPGAKRNAVQMAAEARLARLNAQRGVSDGAARIEIQPWTLSRDGGGDGVIIVFLGILVGLLLVVCAANVATLLLVRGHERASALAVHAALGASRTQVGLQLFSEAVLISAAGGVLGFAVGAGVLRWMEIALSAHWGYYWMTMEARWPVQVGTFAVVIVTALIAGSVPALRAMRVNLAGVLSTAGRTQDVKQRRLGRWFVGAQVAFSTLGLIAAAYMLWEFARADDVTARLPVDRVAVGAITLPDGVYGDEGSRSHLVQTLRRELATMPGSVEVSLAGGLPGGSGGMARLHLPEDAADMAPRRVQWLAADPQLVPLYDMRVRSGRSFTDRDDALAPAVALVTPAFAQRYFDGDAVGRVLRLDGVHGDEYAEVVGVIDDWFPGPDGAGNERVIVPLAQAWPARLAVAVRTNGDPHQLLPLIRAAVARVDGRLAVEDLATLDDRMNWFLRMTRVISMFGVFGGVASALVAAIGLYGVMAFQVRSRFREIGIRMAVGASSGRIVFEVVRESVVRVAPGLAVGMVGGVLASWVIDRFGGTGGAAPSALVLAGVLAAMLGIGVVAGFGPALRAGRLNPLEVLRSD